MILNMDETFITTIMLCTDVLVIIFFVAAFVNISNGSNVGTMAAIKPIVMTDILCFGHSRARRSIRRAGGIDAMFEPPFHWHGQ